MSHSVAENASACGILPTPPLPAAGAGFPPDGGPPIHPLEAVAQDRTARAPRAEQRESPPLALVQHEAPPAARARILLRACRPRQWAKNLLVLAAPCAAGVLGHGHVAAEVLGAFVVMCMVSSATYLVNDVRDRDQDRLHPTKRRRPIASGELSPAAALRAAAVLAVAGVAIGFAIAPGLGAVAIGYLALTATYSLWWRHIVVLDILAIAAGFVLRALAGGVATDVYLSRWFVLVTAFGAVFLVAAKRLAELRDHSGDGPSRATLEQYSPGSLRLTLATAAGAASIAYISWAVTRPAHEAWYVLSIVPFLGWLGRYTALIGAGAGQAPEELILRDRKLLALSVAWALLFLGGVYVGR
jgi:decaprenyl-phosphate phosphoribosyltransferase